MIDDALDEHDEGYFASMTDIMVGLLFVFIIIIMFFALQISESEPDAVSRIVHDEVVTERDRALAEVNGLRRVNSELSAELDARDRTIAVQVEEIDRLRVELALLERRIDDAVAQRDRALQKVAELERINADLTAEVERLRALIVSLELRLAEAEEELAARDRTIAAQIEEIDRLRAEVAALRRRVEVLEAELRVAREDRLSTYLSAADDRRSLILREIREIMADVGVDVEIVEEQGIVRLPNDLLFDPGRSTIDDDGRAFTAVSQLADALRRVLPCYTLGPRSRPERLCNPSAAFVETVFVEGHTDDSPVRGEIEPGIDSNLRLSARRASNIFQRMLQLDRDLIEFASVDREPVLNVAAYGETRPVAGREERSRNRRIDLRFLMYTPRSDTLDRVQALVEDAPEAAQ